MTATDKAERDQIGTEKVTIKTEMWETRRVTNSPQPHATGCPCPLTQDPCQVLGRSGDRISHWAQLSFKGESRAVARGFGSKESPLSILNVFLMKKVK